MGNGQQVRAAIWSLSGSGRGANGLQVSHITDIALGLLLTVMIFSQNKLKISPVYSYMDWEVYFLPKLL